MLEGESPACTFTFCIVQRTVTETDVLPALYFPHPQHTLAFLPTSRSSLVALLHVLDPHLSPARTPIARYLHPSQLRLNKVLVGPRGLWVEQADVGRVSSGGVLDFEENQAQQPQRGRRQAAPVPAKPAPIMVGPKDMACLRSQMAEWKHGLGGEWGQVRLKLSQAAVDLAAGKVAGELRGKEGYRKVLAAVHGLLNKTQSTVIRVGGLVVGWLVGLRWLAGGWAAWSVLGCSVAPHIMA